MALFHCPTCGLPLTDAEARQADCPVCGTSLTAPAAARSPDVSAPTPAIQRRPRRWLWLTGTTVVLLIIALLWWRGSVDTAESAGEGAAPPAADSTRKNDAPAVAVATLPAPKPRTDSERAAIAYPTEAASVKAPGDAVTDGDVGAQAKPAPVPEPVEPPAPKVADQRPVPPLPDPFPAMPNLRVFPDKPFPGMPGGARLADNDIEQLLKMAFAQQQDLEKLFNMAGMQDLDLLGTAKALQGFGMLQGLQPRRALTGPFGGAAAALAGEVVLTGNGITDRDLEALRDKTGLRSLSLAGTAITDAGMEHLKRLKGLRRLNLSGTRVTDKGLEALDGLTDLRELDLSNTRVTDAGSKRLQQALPDVEITR